MQPILNTSSKEVVRFLPTNRQGERLRVAFTPCNGKVFASLYHNKRAVIKIHAWDLPEEMQKFKSIVHFNAFFSNAYATVRTMNNGDCTLRISQKIKGGVGEDLPAVAMRLMADGIERIRNANITPNIIFLIGRVGAGKSAFANVLCNHPLQGVAVGDENPQFTFEAVGEAPFRISHSTNVAGTRIPGIQTVGNLTIIDPPGFGDPAGAYNEIVNNFYRKEITTRAQTMKFILVVDYQDIYDRERTAELERTLNDLLRFLGCCREAQGLAMAAPSISLLVTKVHPGLPLQEVRESLEERFAPQSSLTPNAKWLLRHITRGNRWSIFSKPDALGPSPRAVAEGAAMSGIVTNHVIPLRCIDAQIQATVNPNFHVEILLVLTRLFQEVRQKMGPLLLQEIDRNIQARYEAAEGFDQIAQLLRSLHQGASHDLTFMQFVLQLHIRFPLPEICRNGALRHDFSLEFLTSQLPAERLTEEYRSQRNWLQTLRMDADIAARITLAEGMAVATQPTFSNNTITFQAYAPRLSEINTLLHDAGVQDVKEVVIYGLHEVIVDEDLRHEKLKGANVTIIAPNWHIHGERRIILSGSESTAVATDQPAGTPGVAGNGGGHFFGLAQLGEGFERLKVVSNGGTGGAGQDGEVGQDGKEGKDAISVSQPAHKGGEWEEVENEESSTRDRTHINRPLENGEKGGDGGRAGAGGAGGRPGTATLIVTSDPSIVLRATLKEGEPGPAGKPGRPGRGGMRGRIWKGIWNHHRNEWNKGQGFELGYKEWDDPYAPPGDIPNALNCGGEATPAPAIDITKQLLGFKGFFVAAGNYWTTPYHERFVQNYEQDIRVRGYASTDRFMQECNGVEEIYARTSDKKRCLPLYYSLLSRITHYIAPEDSVKLQHLCALTLSKICQIQAAASPQLIINMRGYLASVLQNINDLVTLNRADAIRVYAGQYEEELKAKIKESEGFIQLLKDDIHATHADITRQVRNLRDQVRVMIAQGLEASAACRKQKEALKSMMLKKTILSGISIVIQCVGSCIYPPAGAIAAAIINAGIKFAFEPTIENGVIQAANLEGTSAQLDQTVASLDAANTPREIRQNLVRLQGVAMASRAVVQEGYQAQQTLQQGQEGLAALDARLEQLDAQIRNLHNYRANIENNIETPLRQLVEQGENLQQQMQDRSVIAREYGRLYIKRIFDATRRQMQLATQGFEAGDGFVVIVQQMLEAIQTSMNINDRVQDYEERIRLTGYMANLANPTVGVQDPLLDAYRTKVQYHLVLEQYERLLLAMRQWAFPFGVQYMQDVTRVEGFNQSASVADMVTVIERDVNRLSQRVEDHYSQLRAVIHGPTCAMSYLGTEHSPPFFVWRGRERPQVLHSLLSGQEVLLNADVRRSHPGHGATKFNRVDLRLRSTDPVLQRQLDVSLLNYDIYMTHSGQSHYRYGENVYRMDNDGGFYLHYSFALNGDNLPVVRNDAYIMMRGGNMMLSPYTLWRVKLTERVTGQPGLIQLFGNRLNDIEIQLLGEGQYVQEEDAVGLVLDPCYEALRQ